MPNWCECELKVEGDTIERTRFKEVAEGKPYSDEPEKVIELDFNKFIKMPEELAKTEGWYDWCIANWDTKWNACDIDIQEDEYSLDYDFQTAWSPPIAVIKAMIKQFPKLTFTLRYFEQGMEFNGYMGGKNGIV